MREGKKERQVNKVESKGDKKPSFMPPNRFKMQLLTEYYHAQMEYTMG